MFILIIDQTNSGQASNIYFTNKIHVLKTERLIFKGPPRYENNFRNFLLWGLMSNWKSLNAVGKKIFFKRDF